MKYCNEESHVYELEDHEFLPKNVQIVWITRRHLCTYFSTYDTSSNKRIVEMENDSILRLKYRNDAGENTDNPNKVTKDEVGRWQGFNLVWQWSTLDYDDICAIPSYDREMTMKTDEHECKSVVVENLKWIRINAVFTLMSRYPRYSNNSLMTAETMMAYVHGYRWQ